MSIFDLVKFDERMRHFMTRQYDLPKPSLSSIMSRNHRLLPRQCTNWTQYNSVSFETVHTSWQEWWPKNGQTILDIGAGNGRDAQWLNERGCEVVAVEPADALRTLG